MRFGEKLKEIREAQDMTKESVSRLAGVSPAYIGHLEASLKRPPPPNTLEHIIEALRVPTKEAAELKRLALIERSSVESRGIVRRALGKENQIVDLPKNEEDYAKIPLLGSCPASAKMWVADEVDGWFYFPQFLITGKRMYLLKVIGDSMDRVIQAGDIVLVDADAEPRAGEIVVVCSDQEYTMKRFNRVGESIILSPDSNNPIHQPMIIDKKNEVKLRGVVRSITMKEIK